MEKTRRDYSIFKKFDFTYKPVGIKFLLNKPADIKQLDKSMPICQMLREAQISHPFYAGKDNFSCVDRLLLGFIEPEPTMEGGKIGEKEKIYQEARANGRIYQYVPRVIKGTVRYVAFSQADEMSFEPDVLIFTARPDQAEIIMRALSYSTGKPLSTKWTPVLSCAWIFFQPYVNGELNYTMTGLGYGIRIKKLFPEGMALISVPYDQIAMLIENLKEMEWVLPITLLNDEERQKYSVKVTEEIKKEYLNG